MNDLDRQVFLTKLKEVSRKLKSLNEKPKMFKKSKDTSELDLMKELLYFDYECEHEYGIRTIDPVTYESKCICLDCGRHIDDSMFEKIFDLDNKYYLTDVRKRYLSLLQDNSSLESISILMSEFELTSSLTKKQ